MAWLLPSSAPSVPEASPAPDLRRIHRLVRVLRGLLVIAIALPVGFLAVVAWASYGTTIDAARTLVLRSLEVVNESTLKLFDTQELILDRAIALAGRLDRSSDTDALAAALHSLETGRSQIASIWIIGPDGTIRASSVPGPWRFDAADRDYFKAQRGQDAGTYVGRTFIGRATGHRSFGFSRRLPSPDGSFQGVASISVSADFFSSAFHRALPEIKHVVALIRDDGEVLVRDPPESAISRLPSDDPLMRAASQSDAGLIWRVSLTDGRERLYGYRHIEGYPLVVVVALSRAAILRPWRANMLLYAAIAFPVVLALSGLAVFALREVRREEAALLRLAEASRQRAEAETRLLQAQKLETLGQLVGTMAHDFGNLLTPIMGNLHLLRERLADPASPTRVNSALIAAERGEKLVRSLLTVARQQPLALSTIDVNALLREMEDLLRQSLGQAASLAFDLAADLWLARADASGLEMAVLNLIINARDAMTAPGSVRISSANVTVGGEHDNLYGDFIAIAVADSGRGMPPDVLAHAFEPFFTTKGAGRGTGLGLASLHGFARQCGGGARISSAAGQGTTVTMFLPRAASA